MNIKKAVDELHRSFKLLNKEFFQDELPMVAITIQSKGKRNAMGWCSTKEIWSDKEGKVLMYEINISAEFLNIPLMDTIDTILHEMVHLYNAINGVQDCSRGGTFHNKRFKAEAENRGFHYDAPSDPKYGWSFCKLTEESKERIQKLGINEEAFSIARMEAGKRGAKKSTSYKWVCPECDMKLRSTKPEVKIACVECSDFDSGEIVIMEEG
jgi:predicted metallopeptidase